MSQDHKLLNKSTLEQFLAAAKQVKVASAAPKFEVGDFIINTKFKVISKIIDIRGIFENEDRTYNYDAAEYVMQDIKNDTRDGFMSGVDRANGSGNAALTHTVQRNYKRYKRVQAIDAYYSKINPDAARIMYGNKVSNDNDGDSDV